MAPTYFSHLFFFLPARWSRQRMAPHVLTPPDPGPHGSLPHHGQGGAQAHGTPTSFPAKNPPHRVQPGYHAA